MTEAFLSTLPNLSIGVVSVVVLAGALYVFVRYLERRDAREDVKDAEHRKELGERERHARQLESEFRTSIVSQLAKNTEAMAQSSQTILSATKIMDRLLTDGIPSRSRRQA